MRPLIRSFKKFRWKVIKHFFKNRLELERLMMTAHLLDLKKSLYRFEYKSKSDKSDIDSLIENYF